MKTQPQINGEQKQINDDQVILNDKTKFDLKFNNIYAIVISVVTIVVLWFSTIGGLKGDIDSVRTDLKLNSQKMDTVIANQIEITKEFREWKTQAETRLGTVESRQNTVISYLQNHLQILIK